MKPYYKDEYATIYHGDCKDFLNQVEDVNLLLTDPPYGIGIKGTVGGNKIAKVTDYGDFNNWDESPIKDSLIQQIIGKADKAIIWGGNYYSLPPSRCWLVWDKLNGSNYFADCELAWTNLNMAVRKIELLWNGMIRVDSEKRYHPTQKPIKLMSWCIEKAGGNAVKTILDPFMGSGTVLRAAKDRNIKCIGIEKIEKYCEVAADRLSQEVLPLQF